jgi:hypothetical protein
VYNAAEYDEARVANLALCEISVGHYHMSPFTLAQLLTLLTILMMAPGVGAQNQIGHVVDIRGDWYFYPQSAETSEAQKLSKWQDVLAGGVIRIKLPAAGDYITVVDVHLNVLVDRKCDSPNACYQPIFLPRGSMESGVSDELDSLFKRAWALLWGESPVASLYRVRGTAPLLNEGVALLPHGNGKVNLAGLMTNMPKGKYLISVYHDPVAGKLVTDDTSSFDWDPATSTLNSIGSRNPGLYEISLLPPNDDSPSTRISVRVLLSSPEGYPEASASFERVRSQTNAWTGAASPEAIHEFLRAFLTQLALANTKLQH